ncbi:MAG: hypothetical protein HY688_01375 [Chloroflexi bacterium]|nr:hypothetical protein [Chloroflexota bacterium]
MGQVEGIGTVTGDATKRTVTIGFDPRLVAVEEVLVAMRRIGYPATVVPA